MGYLTNFYRDSHKKELEKWLRKLKKQHLDTISLEIEFKIACDVTESVNLVEFHEFYDVTTSNSISGRSADCI